MGLDWHRAIRGGTPPKATTQSYGLSLVMASSPAGSAGGSAVALHGRSCAGTHSGASSSSSSSSCCECVPPTRFELPPGPEGSILPSCVAPVELSCVAVGLLDGLRIVLHVLRVMLARRRLRHCLRVVLRVFRFCRRIHCVGNKATTSEHCFIRTFHSFSGSRRFHATACTPVSHGLFFSGLVLQLICT